ncbi:hypothetical protein IBA8401_45160 [Pseudomonas syringae]
MEEADILTHDSGGTQAGMVTQRAWKVLVTPRERVFPDIAGMRGGPLDHVRMKTLLTACRVR